MIKIYMKQQKYTAPEINDESILSMKPPWPGINFPASFFPARRLMQLSTKSPRRPVELITIPIKTRLVITEYCERNFGNVRMLGASADVSGKIPHSIEKETNLHIAEGKYTAVIVPNAMPLNKPVKVFCGDNIRRFLTHPSGIPKKDTIKSLSEEPGFVITSLRPSLPPSKAPVSQFQTIMIK